MKILLIGATHGNETLGVSLYERIINKHPFMLDSIDFIIGNPRAFAQKIRFTEHDLNRCYRVGGDTYERRRAVEIEQRIRMTQPDIVLDIHTTTCEQKSCLIVHNLNGVAKLRMLRASHIDTILKMHYMQDIAILADNIIGYEIPVSQINDETIEKIIQDIEYFIDQKTYESKKQLFTVTDKIFKNEITQSQASTFKNFEKHNLGFVPVLTGENSYKKQTDYIGFKANDEGIVTV